MDLSKLQMAAKLAKVIDDDVERDEALCNVAQMQSAADDIVGTMDTIDQIRYVDIRADAWRKTLDNALVRYRENVCNIPRYSDWTNVLLSTTLEISNPVTRQNKFFPLLAFTISSFDKPTALEFLAVARDEVNQIKNPFARLFNLFAVCHHYQTRKEMDLASAVLDVAQKGLEHVRPIGNQGSLVAMVALEYWKMQDYLSAFDCIGRMKSRKGQTYAYQHLAELLAMGGMFKDAQSILDQMDDGISKEIGQKIVSLGKQLYKLFPPEQRKSIVNFAELHPEDKSNNAQHDSQIESENESDQDDDSGPEDEGLQKILSGLNLDMKNVDLHIGVQIVNINGDKISAFGNDDEDDSDEDDSDEDDEDNGLDSDNDSDDSDEEEDDNDDDDDYDENSMDMLEPFRSIRERQNRFPGGPEDILKEKIGDFYANMEEVGFDKAWQEILEQGDYRFAVDRALEQFQKENASELVFGPENHMDFHQQE